LILTCSSLDVEKYMFNIIAITYLRFAIQIVIIVNMFQIPAMALGLLLFGIMDLIFGIISIYLIKVNGFSLNIFNNI
ncbi:MAG: hypothetical protein ACFFDH_09330, partial [Promethearchaeota archaeon]